MNYKKMIIITVFFIAVVIAGIFFFNKLKKINYIPTPYELELIKYFKEVALQSEHGDKINKIVKWQKPMVIYIVKDDIYKEQMTIIQNSIDLINGLVTDGFKIEITENEKECNSYIYLCKKERIAKLNPDFYKKITNDIDYDISGYADIQFYWSNHNIYKTSIYIDPSDTIDVHKSIILEEITQSIGLPYDPVSHPNSIFYENKSVEENYINEYSEMDEDIIKLLYHPKMRPALNEKQVERVIKRILKNREVELSGDELK